MGAGQEGMSPEMQKAINQVQEQAATQVETLSEQLRKAQGELTNRTLQINREADTKVELANIERDAKIQVAEIARVSDDKISGLMDRINQLTTMAQEAQKAADEANERAEKIEKAPPPAAL